MHAVEIERSGRVTVIRASGELDAFAAGDLERSLTDSRDSKWILVDLVRVSFMDSTALGSLVRGVRGLSAEGSEVRVVLPRGPARRIFEITALEQAFPVVADVRAGLRELAGS